MDEAMHPLTILATGLYGVELPNQNGAPLRLVVPWKYGFKSIKSIVRISFTEKEPYTTWNDLAPDEYGFYAVENRMHVHDLHATLLYLLGLDHKRLTYRHAGRDFRLTDVAGEVARKILA